MSYDSLIRNGTIVDGADRERFVGDVAVKDGRVAKIGAVDPAAPARLMGLKDRGELRVGAWADITIFDKDTVDTASVQTRNHFPAGAPDSSPTPSASRESLWAARRCFTGDATQARVRAGSWSEAATLTP